MPYRQPNIIEKIKETRKVKIKAKSNPFVQKKALVLLLKKLLDNIFL